MIYFIFLHHEKKIISLETKSNRLRKKAKYATLHTLLLTGSDIMSNHHPQIAIVMGSKSDWATMQEATAILDQLQLPYHVEIVSAHRTPDKLFQFAESAVEKGYKVIIAGAGGAAHLPGMIAAKTIVPVLGVPVKSSILSGVDSLYSIVQMPKGIPVGTLAIGPAGAANAGLLAAQILAAFEPDLARRLWQFREKQTNDVLENPDPRKE